MSMSIHFSLRAAVRVILSFWPCLFCLLLTGLIEVVARPTSMEVPEFQAFYQENLSLIYHYVFGKVRNHEEAEDLTSQIFLKAMRHLDHSRSSQSKRSWLYRVARTTIADYWRSHYGAPTNSLETLLETGWEGLAENAPFEVSSNAIERVHRILQALPDQYREVLICRFLLGLSVKETASKLNLTEVNVKTSQFRALKRAAKLESRGDPLWSP